MLLLLLLPLPAPTPRTPPCFSSSLPLLLLLSMAPPLLQNDRW